MLFPISHVPGAKGSGLSAVVLTALVSAPAPKNEAIDLVPPMDAKAVTAKKRTSPIRRLMDMLRMNERYDRDNCDMIFTSRLFCFSRTPIRPRGHKSAAFFLRALRRENK